VDRLTDAARRRRRRGGGGRRRISRLPEPAECGRVSAGCAAVVDPTFDVRLRQLSSARLSSLVLVLAVGE